MKRVGLKLFAVIAMYLWAETAFAATGQTTTITNNNGDLVTVQLTGVGSLTVSLVNISQGPINRINLSGTDGNSALTIKVKKSAKGNGRIAVKSITGTGSLKSLTGTTTDIVGDGINFGGSIGKVTIGNLTSSGITIGGAGVSPTALALASLTAGTIVNWPASAPTTAALASAFSPIPGSSRRQSNCRSSSGTPKESSNRRSVIFKCAIWPK